MSEADVQELFALDPIFFTQCVEVDSADDLWKILISSKKTQQNVKFVDRLE